MASDRERAYARVRRLMEYTADKAVKQQMKESIEHYKNKTDKLRKENLDKKALTDAYLTSDDADYKKFKLLEYEKKETLTAMKNKMLQQKKEFRKDIILRRKKINDEVIEFQKLPHIININKFINEEKALKFELRRSENKLNISIQNFEYYKNLKKEILNSLIIEYAKIRKQNISAMKECAILLEDEEKINIEGKKRRDYLFQVVTKQITRNPFLMRQFHTAISYSSFFDEFYIDRNVDHMIKCKRANSELLNCGKPEKIIILSDEKCDTKEWEKYLMQVKKNVEQQKKNKNRINADNKMVLNQSRGSDHRKPKEFNLSQLNKDEIVSIIKERQSTQINLKRSQSFDMSFKTKQLITEEELSKYFEENSNISQLELIITDKPISKPRVPMADERPMPTVNEPDVLMEDERLVIINAVPNNFIRDEQPMFANTVPNNFVRDEQPVLANTVPNNFIRDEQPMFANAVPNNFVRDEQPMFANTVLNNFVRDEQPVLANTVPNNFIRDEQPMFANAVPNNLMRNEHLVLAHGVSNNIINNQQPVLANVVPNNLMRSEKYMLVNAIPNNECAKDVPPMTSNDEPNNLMSDEPSMTSNNKPNNLIKVEQSVFVNAVSNNFMRNEQPVPANGIPSIFIINKQSLLVNSEPNNFMKDEQLVLANSVSNNFMKDEQPVLANSVSKNLIRNLKPVVANAVPNNILRNGQPVCTNSISDNLMEDVRPMPLNDEPNNLMRVEQSVFASAKQNNFIRNVPPMSSNGESNISMADEQPVLTKVESDILIRNEEVIPNKPENQHVIKSDEENENSATILDSSGYDNILNYSDIMKNIANESVESQNNSPIATDIQNNIDNASNGEFSLGIEMFTRVGRRSSFFNNINSDAEEANNKHRKNFFFF